MRVFRDLSIRYKLTLLLLGVVGVVLLAASVATVISSAQITRASMAAKYTTLAKIVAAQSGAALSIADVDASGAQQIMSDLKAEPSISYAALYDAKGTEVAHFPADTPLDRRPLPPQDLGALYTRGGFLDVVEEVRQNDGAVIGRIYLRATTEELYVRIQRIIGISIVVFVLALVFALVLSFALQRFISAPILQLAQMTRRVSSEYDYTLRAEKRGNDELGALCDGFNTMLAEIRRREDERRASEERFHAVIENMTEGIVISDLDGRILHWNRAALDFHGFGSSTEWCRRLPTFTDILELSTLDDQIVSLEHWPLSRLLRGERLRNHEVRVRRRDTGRQRIFSYGGDIVLDGTGKQVAFLTMFDVTERKQAEAKVQSLNAQLERQLLQLTEINRDLSEKNQENEMFVYSVSHDLRSPLVNLQGFSRELATTSGELRLMLATSELPPESKDPALRLIDQDMRESIRFIQTAVTRLAGIIDALLRLSRAGRIEYQMTSIDTGSVVARVVESMSGSIYEAGATVRIADLPPAYGDPTAVEQIFANLIGNALKYCDPSRPCEIVVGYDPGEADVPANCKGAYYVRDNGLGIAEAYLPKVFQAFKRLHPNVASGEGMGLAIVRRMVERHGGKVWVKSTVGAGSTFLVTLPFPTTEAPPDIASNRLQERMLEYENAATGHSAR